MRNAMVNWFGFLNVPSVGGVGSNVTIDGLSKF